MIQKAEAEFKQEELKEKIMQNKALKSQKIGKDSKSNRTALGIKDSSI